MSKTKTPPSEKELEKEGIRFVPTNCFAPNHWAVKHMMFSFEGFDTRSEFEARKKAALVNQIAYCLEINHLLDQKTVLVPSILRQLGFDVKY